MNRVLVREQLMPGSERAETLNQKDFKAERVSRRATITLNDAIEVVFPLFGPIEEKKWADGWDPVALYPASGNLEEGMVFRTPGHEEHENQFFWIVSKYQPANFVVEYIVSTPNRYWVIHIRCAGVSENETMATITYTYTGLNHLGNEINRQAIENMYKDYLRDWEEAINYYLKTGNTLPQH